MASDRELMVKVQELIKQGRPLAAGFEDGWGGGVVPEITSDRLDSMRLMYFQGAAHVLHVLSNTVLNDEKRNAVLTLMQMEVDELVAHCKELKASKGINGRP
jgi:hypothetical protein